MVFISQAGSFFNNSLRRSSEVAVSVGSSAPLSKNVLFCCVVVSGVIQVKYAKKIVKPARTTTRNAILLDEAVFCAISLVVRLDEVIFALLGGVEARRRILDMAILMAFRKSKTT